MINRISILALSVCFGVAACATTNSAKPKLEVLYQSSTSLADTGAAIDGKLCFESTHWDVTNKGDAVDVRDYERHYLIGPSAPSEHRLVGSRRFVAERPEAAERLSAIRSQPHKGQETIDLRFGPDHLSGRIGWHQFVAGATGDHLEGTYQQNGMTAVVVRIFGMDALWALPLAEQAVLLPSLLFCANTSPTHDFDIDLRDLKHTP
jgi:hypothetical protein